MSFLDDWKEWSTAKKAISIIGVCCIGILIIAALGGGLSQDKNTAPTTKDTSNNNDDAAKDQPKGVQVHIITDGEWSGSIGDTSSQSTYDGTGEDTIDIKDAQTVVSAVIQKKGGDSSELKVEILKDGKVIKDGSTTGEYGVVTVSTTI